MSTFPEGRPEVETKMTLRPIVGLTEGLPKGLLEPIVIEAILRHRLLRDVADIRQKEMSRHAGYGEEAGSSATAYIRAMIDLHAQQTVLSTLLDVLGYVPDMPAD